MPSWPSDPDGHAAEEARLAFVALTRARRRVYVTYADSYLRQAGPPVFLDLAAPEADVREVTRASARLEPSNVRLAREAEVVMAAQRGPLDDATNARASALGLDGSLVADS